MAHKVILIADPGIDTAFAVALALHDPETRRARPRGVGGEHSRGPGDSERAPSHQRDRPAQVAAARSGPAGQYEIDGTKLHGPDGLGNVELPPVSLHQPTPGDKTIVELVRTYPREVTIVVLGPATVLARAFDRDPELPGLIDRIVFLGGAWRVPGNATAVAEFHFYCDPAAARQVLRCGRPITLIPLDAARKLVFSPTDLLELPSPDSATCMFLRKIVPYGIRASSNLYGIEGFHLKDVLGVAAVALPAKFTLEPAYVDVELRGELTRGMSVFDTRPTPGGAANVDVVTNVDIVGVRDYIHTILSRTG